MAWNPMVKTARFGKQWSRARRMHNYATTKEAASTPAVGASIWSDYRDITGGPLMTQIIDPTGLNEFASLGINTTSGGTWGASTSSGNDILFGGSWTSSLTFTGAGSYALLHSIKYSNTYRWAVVSSKGVT